jgi:hypothetical protein
MLTGIFFHPGSGKTAAFLVPVLHQLKEPRKGGYRAVIIVPTKGQFSFILANISGCQSKPRV